MRVPGHHLVDGGAPFYGKNRPRPVNIYGGVSGTGFAQCSCGAQSEVLDSGAARKRWHDNHRYEEFAPTEEELAEVYRSLGAAPPEGA